MMKPGGDDCFDNERHSSEHLAEPSRRKNKPRRPGDDEFGVQPRMRGSVSRKKRNGRRSAENATKPQSSRKNKRGGKRSQKSSTKKNVGGEAPKKTLTKPSETHMNVQKFLAACDLQPWNPIPHSTKTKAALDLVRKWQAEAPNDKIISMCSFPKAQKEGGGGKLTKITVFVQWIPMLAILGRMIFQNGLRFVYYWGLMNETQKARSIRGFKCDPEIKVMVSPSPIPSGRLASSV